MPVRFNSKLNDYFEERYTTYNQLVPSGLVESGNVQLIAQLDKDVTFSRTLLNPLEVGSGTQDFDIVGKSGEGVYDVNLFKKLKINRARILVDNTQVTPQDADINIRMFLNPSASFTIYTDRINIPASGQGVIEVIDLELPFDVEDIGTIRVQVGSPGPPFFINVNNNIFAVEATLKDY